MEKVIMMRRAETHKKKAGIVQKTVLPTLCFAALSTIAFEKEIHAAQNTSTNVQITSEGTQKYVNTASGTLNLRESASGSAAVIAALTKGTAVTVYGETNGWSKVNANGKYGYVSSIYLSSANPGNSANTSSSVTTTKYVNIASGRLNLRESPSTGASVILSLAKGVAVTVISEINGWSKVNVNGKTGYLSSEFISATSLITSANTSTASSTTKYVDIASGTLNLRESPSTAAPVVQAISKGTSVTVYSEANGWAKVKANGKDGYVNSGFLSAINPTTPVNGSTAVQISPATPAPVTKYVSVSSGSLNMRKSASTDASIIVKLAKGTSVKVYTEASGWSKIEAYGQTGYVRSEFLVANLQSSTPALPPVLQTLTRYVNVSSGSTLNLRNTNSISSAVLAKLQFGLEVQVISNIDGWAKVSVNGKEGYVSSDFLSETKPKTSSNATEEQQVITKYVNVNVGSSLNMRKIPSENSSVILKIARGVAVIVKSESNGWANIEAYGQTGYVSSDYLIATKPAAGSDPAAGSNNGTSTETESGGTNNGSENGSQNGNGESPARYVNVIYGSSLNLRSTATVNGTVISKLARGTIVTVESEENGWSKITLNGISGFVSSQYLSAAEPFNPIQNNGTSDTAYESYGISLNEMSSMQMAVNPQTDKKYNTFLRADALNLTSPTSGTVNGSKWNVRGGAGTDFWVVGQVSNSDTLKILSKVKGSDGFDWYQVNYDKTWVNASPDDVQYYLDPNNFVNSTVDSLQFLKLSVPTALDSTEVNNRILNGKGILQGKASAFISAGNTYGINEIYLISHALLESGNGTSQLATGVQINGKTVYNMYGIGAYDSNAVSSGAQFAYNAGWFTPEDAIIGGAKFIANGYINIGQDTLYKMRWNPDSAVTNGYASHQYATDIGWASKQVGQIYNLYNLLDSYQLILDIPKYQ